MPRIQDVATQAGTSVGTVSRVINGTANVRPELRQRVEAAIDALGYRPNVVARSLRRRRSHTFGLIIPDITNPFFSELAKHIESAAAAGGYSLILGNSHDSLIDERLYLETLIDRQVDGVILVPSFQTRRLPTIGDVPVVVVDRPLPGVDVVTIDHEGGARSAVEYLLSLGHELIACIAGPLDLTGAGLRYRGYVSTAAASLARHGLKPEDYTHSGLFDYDSGFEAARALLRMSPRPTAIFASSDQQAIGALRACSDLDLAVPGDVSIIGFDDIDLARLVTPRLTTVGQPIDRISEIAIERLLQRAATKTSRHRKHTLSTELRIRDSTAPPTTQRLLARLPARRTRGRRS